MKALINKNNIHTAKKAVLKIVTALCSAVLMAAAVFAEGEGGEAIPTFFSDAIDILKIVVLLIGGGIGVWGVINLLEGYGGDNPASRSQGLKQLMAGLGIAVVAIFLIPALKDLMNK